MGNGFSIWPPLLECSCTFLLQLRSPYIYLSLAIIHTHNIQQRLWQGLQKTNFPVSSQWIWTRSKSGLMNIHSDSYGQLWSCKNTHRHLYIHKIGLSHAVSFSLWERRKSLSLITFSCLHFQVYFLSDKRPKDYRESQSKGKSYTPPTSYRHRQYIPINVYVYVVTNLTITNNPHEWGFFSHPHSLLIAKHNNKRELIDIHIKIFTLTRQSIRWLPVLHSTINVYRLLHKHYSPQLSKLYIILLFAFKELATFSLCNLQ